MSLNPKAVFEKVASLLSGNLTETDKQSLLLELAPEQLSAAALAEGAKAMLAASVQFKHFPQALDTCGTGGDGANTLNVSTATALVLSATGTMITKHGNRSVSSQSGSADVLKALGVNITPSHTQLETALTQTNLAFLFAPDFHPALGNLREARKAIQARSIFNLLGPLTNPARPTRQLIGVYDKNIMLKILEAAQILGTESCMVVHAEDGLDECSISSDTYAATLKNGVIHEHIIQPEGAGLPRHAAKAIQGGNAETNADALTHLLEGLEGAYADAVCLNAAAALTLTGQAANLTEGAHIARYVLQEKKALYLLQRYRDITKEHHE